MPDIAVHSGLGPHRQAWDALVLQGCPPSPFLRSWWLDAVTDERSRFLLVFDGPTLLGGLPLRSHRKHGVARLRTVGEHMQPTNLDVVAAPEYREVVAERVWGWVRAQRNCVVEVDGLLAGSALETVASDVSWSDRSSAPYLRLPESYEQYLADRSKNHRKGLRRDRRRLEDQGFVHRVLGPEETAAGLDELWRLHAQRFGDSSEFLPLYETFRLAAEAGARRGELELHALQRGDRAAAMMAVMELGGVVVGYQGGRDVRDRDLRGAGSVLLDGVIGRSCDAGLREFDFHRYPDNYKLRLASGVRPVRNVSGSWGHRTQALLWARRTRNHVRRTLRRGRP